MSINKDQLSRYLNAEIEAFNTWVWFLGVDSHVNIRDYFSDDELWAIWIKRFAKKFHDDNFDKYYEE